MSKLETWKSVGKTIGNILVMVMFPVIKLVNGVKWVIDTIPYLISGVLIPVILKIQDVMDKIADKARNLYNVGKSMVLNLKNGIASSLDEFLAWIDAKLSSVPLLGSLYGAAKDFFGSDSEDKPKNPIGTNPAPAFAPMSGLGGKVAMSNASKQASTVNPIYKPTFNVPATDMPPLHIYVDGDPIYNNMKKRDEFNNSRR